MLLKANGAAHCALRGCLVNSDGRAKSVFQHPSQLSQSTLLAETWQRSQVDPCQLSMIECHGTGTRIGDPIEVGALASAFGKFGPPTGSKVIASVKSNVGHAGAAAGVIGFIKTCLALKHRLIPASLHCRTLNPDLPLGKCFVVSQELQGFPQKETPCAAVSSFGLGGTNAHAVLEAIGEAAETESRREPTSFRRDVFWHPQIEKTIGVGHGYPFFSSAHPVLGEAPWVNGQKLYPCKLNPRDDRVAFLWQHQVNGKIVFPGASFLELFLEVGHRLGFCEICLQEVGFERPLVLSQENCEFYVALDMESGDVEKGKVRATSLDGQTVFARAVVQRGAPLKSMPHHSEERAFVDVLEAYRKASYGPAFQTVQHMEAGGTTATARLAVQDGGFQRPDFRFEPTLLDGAFQIMLGKSAGEVWPRSVKSVHFDNGGGKALRGAEAKAEWYHSLEGSVQLFDEDQCVLRLECLQFSRKPRKPQVGRPGLAFQGTWDDAPLPGRGFNGGMETSCVAFHSQGRSLGLLGELGKLCDVKLVGLDSGLVFEKDLLELPTNATLLFCVSLECDGSDDLSQQLAASCLCLLNLVRALFHEKGQRSRLLVLTRCAAEVADSAMPLHLSQSAFVGLSRAIQRECPQLTVLHIDLDAMEPAEDAKLLAQELVSDTEPTELSIAYRRSQRYAWRLGFADLMEGQENMPLLQGTYMITGGLGALGLEIGEWLGKQGVSELILVSHREKQSSSVHGKLRNMDQLNCKVSIELRNVSQRDRVDELFNKVGSRLTGIVHAAGVLCDQRLFDVSISTFNSVFDPKAVGGYLLHAASRLRKPQLEHFVLMSSTSSVLGSIGQASYAAANSFLDGLSAKRRQEGLVALSINWGPWAEVGMAAKSKLLPGIQHLPVQDALEALGQACLQYIVLLKLMSRAQLWKNMQFSATCFISAGRCFSCLFPKSWLRIWTSGCCHPRLLGLSASKATTKQRLAYERD